MQTQQRKPKVFGIPVIIAEILRDHPNGADSTTITTALANREVVGNTWTRQHTSNALTNMREKKWVTKWPGNTWKLGPRPVDYHLPGHHPKRGNRYTTAKRRLNGHGGGVHKPEAAKPFKPAASANGFFERANKAIELAITALKEVQVAVAELDTTALKLKQRETAIEAARKLLAGAGI